MMIMKSLDYLSNEGLEIGVMDAASGAEVR